MLCKKKFRLRHPARTLTSFNFASVYIRIYLRNLVKKIEELIVLCLQISILVATGVKNP
jgi:hypothetical protein